MRNISTRYVHGVDVNQPPAGRAPAVPAAGRAGIVVALGAASVLLYALLFWYSDSLTAIAQAARQGEKLYAIVPIAIALVFSLVHGTFTARFWDSLGLRPRNQR